MISVDMLQNMKPEDAARLCEILFRFRMYESCAPVYLVPV